MTSGQFATLALGAPDLMTATSGTDDDKFRNATGLATDGSHLWVTDLNNARVLQFNASPVVFQPKADLVIGQDSFLTANTGPTATQLTIADPGQFASFGDVSSAAGKVVISDGQANRIVILNSIPAASGPMWNVVLGQTTVTGAVTGTTATTLATPQGVWTDGTRIVVADSANNRVLIWNTMPTANGTAADLVLGQDGFAAKLAPSPPTPSSMNNPVDVFFDGERLYVSDSRNNRIMGWNGMPTANNKPADFFVGQASGSTGTANAGAGTQEPNAIGLSIPGEITVARGSLYITDMVNFRVVVHTPRPTTSGESADAVLGNSDLVGGGIAAEQSLTPRGLVVFGDKLYLSDSNLAFGRSRVLRYDLANLP